MMTRTKLFRAGATALVLFGKAAEPTTLRILNPQDLAATKAACEVLARIGTKKSVRLLRQGARSDNQEFARLCLATAKVIDRRLKQEDKATDSKTPAETAK
jgi:hypothetical protein